MRAPETSDLASSSAKNASKASLGLRLLRAAASADPKALAEALDAGAPIDAPFKPNSRARAHLPRQLAVHRKWLAVEGTALSISCLIAADPFGEPGQMARAMDCAKILIERGASPDGAGPRTSSPLSTVVEQALRLNPKQGALRDEHVHALLPLLAMAGADMDARDHSDASPLWRCLRDVRQDLGRLLVELGADIEKPDNRGRPMPWLLAHAASARSLSIALELGADPDGADSEGRSMLWAAVNSASTTAHKISCVRSLMRHGCRMDDEAASLVLGSPLASFLAADLARAQADALDRATAPATAATLSGPRL